MTNEEYLAEIKSLKEIELADTSKDDLLGTLVEIAKSVALRSLYPFHEDIVELPTRYDYWVVQAVGDMYQNLGQESIAYYQENGLKISFRELENGISSSLLGQLLPTAYVVGEEVYAENTEI